MDISDEELEFYNTCKMGSKQAFEMMPAQSLIIVI